MFQRTRPDAPQAALTHTVDGFLASCRIVPANENVFFHLFVDGLECQGGNGLKRGHDTDAIAPRWFAPPRRPDGRSMGPGGPNDCGHHKKLVLKLFPEILENVLVPLVGQCGYDDCGVTGGFAVVESPARVDRRCPRRSPSSEAMRSALLPSLDPIRTSAPPLAQRSASPCPSLPVPPSIAIFKAAPLFHLIEKGLCQPV